jgi:precorrin-3B synthase
MLRSFAPPSVLPDISPAWGEISQSRTPKLQISPLAGEMSGRTERGDVERYAEQVHT